MMDGGNWFWIVMIVLAVVMMSKGGRMNHQQRKLAERLDELQSAPPRPAPVRDGASRQEVERLEQRVRVLERIVTDRGYALASEIEALRDKPAPALGDHTKERV